MRPTTDDREGQTRNDEQDAPGRIGNSCIKAEAVSPAQVDKERMNSQEGRNGAGSEKQIMMFIAGKWGGPWAEG